MICESLKHQNTIDGWNEKVKTAAGQVIDAEEMVLRFPDAPELRVRLNVAWEEYWAISQMAISVCCRVLIPYAPRMIISVESPWEPGREVPGSPAAWFGRRP